MSHQQPAPSPPADGTNVTLETATRSAPLCHLSGTGELALVERPSMHYADRATASRRSKPAHQGGPPADGADATLENATRSAPLCHPSCAGALALTERPAIHTVDCATGAMPRAMAKTTHFAPSAELGGC